jgi:enoyl-CoA hydratase/carnithine racemase
MVTGRRASAQRDHVRSALFAGSMEILKCVTGHRNAEIFALGGRLYSAEGAKALGMVDEIVSPEALEVHAIAAATEFGSSDTDAFAQIKKLLRGPVVEQIQRTEADSIKRFVKSGTPRRPAKDEGDSHKGNGVLWEERLEMAKKRQPGCCVGSCPELAVGEAGV